MSIPRARAAALWRNDRRSVVRACGPYRPLEYGLKDIDGRDSVKVKEGLLGFWNKFHSSRPRSCAYCPSLPFFVSLFPMRQYRALHFLIPFTFLFAVPAFGSDTSLSCADKSIVASAVRTQEDVQAFVQCAYEFVQEVGFAEARRAFNEDDRWKSGPIYVFVDEIIADTDIARAFIFPPDTAREGEPWGALIDVWGNDYYEEAYRLISHFGEGWIYYSFNNPATGQDEPKASYIKGIDWKGNSAAIGAGLYRRDLPGTCRWEEVNATQLDEHPSNQRLQEFVQCATMELETTGYFGLVSLSTDPRWRSHSIYLFGVDMYGKHALYRQPLQLGDGHKPFGVDHHRCPG